MFNNVLKVAKQAEEKQAEKREEFEQRKKAELAEMVDNFDDDFRNMRRKKRQNKLIDQFNLISVNEAAKITGYSSYWIRQKIYDDKINGHFFDQYFISKSDAEKLLQYKIKREENLCTQINLSDINDYIHVVYAAEKIGVSDLSLRRLVQKKIVPGYKNGKSLLMKKSDVEYIATERKKHGMLTPKGWWQTLF